MKRIILTIILFSSFAQAGEICEGYESSEENAFHWSEASFTEKRSKEAMATLQYALDNNGSANTCGLHNALQIVEGYILKQQAQAALASKGASNIIVKVNVGGFCEFLQRSQPCE
jgi:hypothetical protein